MAREKMITRTMDFTNVEAMVVEISTAKVYNLHFQIPGKYDNGPELLEKVRENDTDSVKVVTIVSASVESKLYGMTEADFLKYGKVLPPRTKAEQEEQPEEQAAE